MAQEKQVIIVPLELGEALLQYLENRPHKEVRQLIDAIGGGKVVDLKEVAEIINPKQKE